MIIMLQKYFHIYLFICTICYTTGGWIDPDTKPHDFHTTSYRDSRKYSLVFSDEFNTNGRYFYDGNDPKWTAIHKNDYTNFALHYYNSKLVNTSNGYLNIHTILHDISFSVTDSKGQNAKKITKNYQSGMVQGWNKFCFTGGILEISAKLPGKYNVGGFWPAMWLLGNLARATYVGSSNNVWPWSYNTCDKTLQPQQHISACNSVNHFDLHPHQGRGAPEIDLLEAMPGYEQLSNFLETTTNKPYYSASLQIAPGSQGYRPTTGATPESGLWYEKDLKYGENTSLNIFFYGMHLEGMSNSQSYLADALSANRNIGEEEFTKFKTYRLEWIPGEDGYIEWYMNDEFIYSIEASTLNLTGSIIPEEPMYVLLNTAMSSTWGFPSPCPDGCPCDCFDCRKDECQCAIPENLCSNFPATMMIDYVRVYQMESDPSQTVGCSTKTHPTKKFIKGHPELYKSVQDKEVLKPISHGGGSCGSDNDCRPLDFNPIAYASMNQSDSSFGKCVRRFCVCENYFTGPNCLAYTGFDDIIWEPDEDFYVVQMIIPSSLVLLMLFILVLLVVVVGYQYSYEKDTRISAVKSEDEDENELHLNRHQGGVSIFQWMQQMYEKWVDICFNQRFGYNRLPNDINDEDVVRSIPFQMRDSVDESDIDALLSRSRSSGNSQYSHLTRK